MTTTEPNEVDQLLLDLLERWEDQGERAVETLIDQNPQHERALRERLEVLRRAGLLQAPAGDGLPATVDLEQLGDFRLLKKLGAGGMGVVYLAEQRSLDRHVALKLIRPELAYFEASQSRFKREVEVIASLQHPGIVPIHTVGKERGIPYFAMQLIEGCSLADLAEELHGVPAEDVTGELVSEVVDRRSAAIREALGHGDRGADAAAFRGSWIEIALRVVRQAAEALDYAHERGVVHRDVKPSNLAVTVDGRVLVLDFGLAASERSVRLTRAGSQQGSVPYMSPEQVRAEPLDRRTDVYSLGVTLYELLTNRSAFAHTSSEVTMQKVCSGDFVPPRELNRAIPRDVETVCLVAMDRDASRRYPTAGAFARDLGNLLTRHPIEARRPSLALRVLRWGQRHPRISTGALAGCALALVSAVVISMREHDHRVRIEAERDIARTHAADLRQLAHGFLFDIHESVESLPGATPVRQLLIEKARQLLAKLVETGGDDPAVRRDLGLAHLRLGSLLGMTGKGSLGDTDAAERHLAEAQAIFDSLGPDSDPAVLRELMNTRGIVDMQLGRLDDAVAGLERASELAREILERAPSVDASIDLVQSERQLARIDYERGEVDRALERRMQLVEASAEAAARAPENTRAQRSLLVSLRDAAQSRGRARDVRGALELYQRGVAEGERLVQAAPANVHYRLLLAQALAGSAEMLRRSRRSAEAVEPVKRSLELLDELIAGDPTNADFGVHMLQQLKVATRVFQQERDPARALEHARRGVAIGQRLTADGRTPEARRELAWFHQQAAALLSSRGSSEEAATELDVAVRIMEAVYREQPDNGVVAANLANAHQTAAKMRLGAGDLDGALAAAERFLEVARAWVARTPSEYTARLGSALAYGQLGEVLKRRGDTEEALQSWLDGAETLADLASDYPERGEIAAQLAYRQYRIAQLHADARQNDEAVRHALLSDAAAARGLEHAPGSRSLLECRNAALDMVASVYEAGTDADALREVETKWFDVWRVYAELPGVDARQTAAVAERNLDCEFEELRDPAFAVRLAALALERLGEEDVGVLRLLARAHEANGRLDDAIAALQRARAAASDEPTRAALDAELSRLGSGR